MTPHARLLREYEHARLAAVTRRHFLQTCTTGLGAMFLGSLASRAFAAPDRLSFARAASQPLAPLPPQFAAKAKRVIYLHMAGAPSQLELFDYKPDLTRLDGENCPASFLEGKRFAFISGVPKMLGPQFPFHQAGKSGTWMSDRLPFLEKHVDDMCVIRSMHTDEFNHAPAQLLLHTGSPRLGSPSLGSWVTYGLGTENQNLPGFIVLVSGGKTPDGGKPLWGSGFLPSVYQGVQCRAKGEPVLFLSNPEDVSRSERRRVLDAIGDLDREEHAAHGDPETLTRIAQYELAFRMQVSATDAMDLAREPASVHTLYGTKPGAESFANNCLLARRLAERGVRYIQLYHWGWDSHGTSEQTSLKNGFADLCREIDRPVSALLADLKDRGLLDETLVVWGGEFGRTPMRENRNGQEMKFVGRDHHPGAFTIWLAGGGVKGGCNYGATDAVGYDIAENPVEVRDLQATIVRLLGFDYRKLSMKFQGLDQNIAGVKPTKVIHDIIA